MTIPLFVLAFFAITVGWVGIPEFFPVIGGLVPNWLESFLGMMLHGDHAPAAHHSSIPLITSLVVSLGGLFLGGLLYRNFKATEKDPLEWSLSGFYKVLANKYYIDEIYQFIFIRPATWVAEKVVYQIFDQKIFDGFLHGVGKISIWLGDKFRYWFDLPVINKGGDNMALGARKIGTNLKVTQSGRIQDYMVLALAFSLLGGFIFYLILF
jgi:NADH-quinone oxidoreductase subunit L